MTRRPQLAALLGTVGLLLSCATASAAPAAHVQLRFSQVYFVHDTDAVSVPGRLVELTGLVSPYVAGQRVRVTAAVGRRRFLGGTLRVFRSPNGQLGRFVVRVRAPAAGLVAITVSHARTAAQGAYAATRRYAALDPAPPAPGSRGRFVLLLQERLRALHLYLPLSGVWGLQSELAVDAYHRLLRWGTSSVAGPATIGALLGGVGAFPVRFPKQGHHAEGNLGLQLLALVDGDQVRKIFPISSGKPSTPTILGSYRIYDREPGLLKDGMYYSSFFSGGYAIHGYDPAPDYPASHGCMRLPISDAIPAFNWLALGDWVDSYY